jgi:hypothetical protein
MSEAPPNTQSTIDGCSTSTEPPHTTSVDRS